MWMFKGCTNLTSVNLSSFDTQKVEDMRQMFYDCPNLQTVYIGENFITDLVESKGEDKYSDMFALTGDGTSNPVVYNKQSSSVGNKVNPLFASQTVKTYIPVNAKAEYGTICVPVGSTLAENSFAGFDKLYTVTAADKVQGTITLQEATSLEPGVPYIYHRYVAEGTDEGKITYNADLDASQAATAPKNEGSILKGTFESVVAQGGSYILQSDGDFHLVAEGNATLKVGAYRAYLDLSSIDIDGGDVKPFRMVIGDDDATGMGDIGDGTDKRSSDCYDLTGRHVRAPRAGGIYIVNGKKVMVRE